MNMRLAGGVCAALLLAGCSSGPNTSAATSGGKVSIKAASILPEREMQKACEAIFGPANEVSGSLFGEPGEFTWESDELNTADNYANAGDKDYGVGCYLTGVGSRTPALKLWMLTDPTGYGTPLAEVGAVKIGATRPSGVGALSDQTKNALDELVNKAKDRIAD